MLSKIAELEKKVQVMEEYIMLKFAERDWHAVWDAAIDIQGLEEQIAIYKEMCDVLPGQTK